MTAWRITLVEAPTGPGWSPGAPPRWDWVAEESGIHLSFGLGSREAELRQDIRRFEGTNASRDEALAWAKHAIDKELERRTRYEVVYYPEEPKEADPDGT